MRVLLINATEYLLVLSHNVLYDFNDFQNYINLIISSTYP